MHKLCGGTILCGSNAQQVLFSVICSHCSVDIAGSTATALAINGAQEGRMLVLHRTRATGTHAFAKECKLLVLCR